MQLSTGESATSRFITVDTNARDKVRQRAEFDQRRMQSERSSCARVDGGDGVRSMVRVYVPSLQEKTRAALEGRWGLYLEATNFALSVLIFSVYIAEVRGLCGARFASVAVNVLTAD